MIILKFSSKTDLTCSKNRANPFTFSCVFFVVELKIIIGTRHDSNVLIFLTIIIIVIGLNYKQILIVCAIRD